MEIDLLPRLNTQFLRTENRSSSLTQTYIEYYYIYFIMRWKSLYTCILCRCRVCFCVCVSECILCQTDNGNDADDVMVIIVFFFCILECTRNGNLKSSIEFFGGKFWKCQFLQKKKSISKILRGFILITTTTPIWSNFYETLIYSPWIFELSWRTEESDHKPFLQCESGWIWVKW